MRNPISVLLACALFPGGSLLASLEDHRNVPFSLSSGHFIVVQARVGEHPLRLIIDTGATYSVLDRQVSAELGLTPLTESVTLRAFGREVEAGRVVVSRLSLGAAVTSLPCLVVDLPWSGIDGILGLDFLRRQSLTIDFEKQQISFGRKLELGSRVPFVPDRALVLVPVQLKGRQLLLSVDTGSSEISLFSEAPLAGVRPTRGLRRHFRRDLTGVVPVESVDLPAIELGRGRWTGLRGTVRRTDVDGRDGVLGVASLNLKRLHFEFSRSLLSWER